MSTMSTMHEVERRYKIAPGSVQDLQRVLNDMGFSPSYSQYQIDEYYTSKHKDFISSEECLRIRSVDSDIILTWKPPSTDDMRAAPEFWKQEIEFGVSASADIVRSFLQALDFLPYVTVAKRRRAFADQTGTEVAFDEVQGLGSFIEIEIQSDDIEEARATILRVSEALRLPDDDISTVPYRDLVASRGKE
jgi:adenylate cyclase, class 2